MFNIEHRVAPITTSDLYAPFVKGNHESTKSRGFQYVDSFSSVRVFEVAAWPYKSQDRGVIGEPGGPDAVNAEPVEFRITPDSRRSLR